MVDIYLASGKPKIQNEKKSLSVFACISRSGSIWRKVMGVKKR
jgi:hypothetical protein